MSIGWIYLLIAGAFEVGFTTAMQVTGKYKTLGDIAFLACAITSFAFLDLAVKTIPIGIAYAVWTGIGAVGTLLVSSLVFKSHLTAVQLALVGVLVAAVIGLKLTGAKG